MLPINTIIFFYSVEVIFNEIGIFFTIENFFFLGFVGKNVPMDWCVGDNRIGFFFIFFVHHHGATLVKAP